VDGSEHGVGDVNRDGEVGAEDEFENFRIGARGCAVCIVSDSQTVTSNDSGDVQLTVPKGMLKMGYFILYSVLKCSIPYTVLRKTDQLATGSFTTFPSLNGKPNNGLFCPTSAASLPGSPNTTSPI